MARMPAEQPARPAPRAEPSRLARDQRREAILDVAATMVADGGVDAVSMESVAERAGVSRPLVYKHFADRHDLLDALYKRESDIVHAELAEAVTGAETVEGMFRALVRGALRAEATRGAAFAALRAAGMRTRERRYEQRLRDRTTLRYFARRAEIEFGIEPRSARVGVAILLGAIDAVLAQWRLRPTADNAELLEDAYVQLVVGGLSRLTTR
jgi:AcrR family transcriptional regulator